jgi:hypothetical protein
MKLTTTADGVVITCGGMKVYAAIPVVVGREFGRDLIRYRIDELGPIVGLEARPDGKVLFVTISVFPERPDSPTYDVRVDDALLFSTREAAETAMEN